MLKTFTETRTPVKEGEEKVKASILPFGVNAVKMSGKAFLLGLSSYIVAICAKLASSIDETHISVPCGVVVLATLIFTCISVAKMGTL